MDINQMQMLQSNAEPGGIVPLKSADQDDQMFAASPETMALLRQTAGLTIAQNLPAIATQTMGAPDRLPLYLVTSATAFIAGCGFLLAAMSMSPNARVESIARESIAANAAVANAVAERPTCRAVGLIVMAGACPAEPVEQAQQPNFVTGTEIAVGSSGLVATPTPPPPSGQESVSDEYLHWAGQYANFSDQVLLNEWQNEQCETAPSDRCAALNKALEHRGI